MKLEIGYNHEFEIRHEYFETDRAISECIVYISDLHFNRFSDKMVTHLLNSILNLEPSIIIFGGDYIDTKAGLPHLNNLLVGLKSFPSIFAIAGNHDIYFGLEDIKGLFIQHNVNWIEGESQFLMTEGQRIKISGNYIDKRESCDDFCILALHKPIKSELFENDYNLALAGHLHGCQFVFWKSNQHLYPGKLFYRLNMLKSNFKNGMYLISKGLGDTLPIRYNCKRDIICVQINGRDDSSKTN